MINAQLSRSDRNKPQVTRLLEPFSGALVHLAIPGFFPPDLGVPAIELVTFTHSEGSK